MGNLSHCFKLNATFQNPGSHETITDIITKGLFIDMKHYVQGLELFEEVKVILVTLQSLISESVIS